ncbi:MAG: tetratricopeptide repeat protein [Phycisphaerae bacterium]|nr:tetratricopeptide repeat protein [Phycisphaerae bacterium]
MPLLESILAEEPENLEVSLALTRALVATSQPKEAVSKV